MKRILLAVLCGVGLMAAGGASAFAQLVAPTAAGVSLGAVYYTRCRMLQPTKKYGWITLARSR